MKVTETPNIQYAPYGYSNDPADDRRYIYVVAAVFVLAVIALALILKKR